MVEVSIPPCRLSTGCLNVFNNTVISIPQSKGGTREKESEIRQKLFFNDITLEVLVATFCHTLISGGKSLSLTHIQERRIRLYHLKEKCQEFADIF